MLREEQDRLRRETADVEERLRGVDATLAQWQEILGIAMRFAENCGAAYGVAKERTRALYNRAVFERLIVRDGRVAEPHYAAPFGLVFGVGEFEQGSLERETGLLWCVKGGSWERVEYLSGDVAFEAAKDLGLGEAFGGAPLHIDLGAFVEGQPAHGDPPEGSVALPITATIQPVALGLAGLLSGHARSIGAHMTPGKADRSPSRRLEASGRRGQIFSGVQPRLRQRKADSGRRGSPAQEPRIRPA